MRAVYSDVHRRIDEGGLTPGVGQAVAAAIDGLWLYWVLGLGLSSRSGSEASAGGDVAHPASNRGRCKGAELDRHRDAFARISLITAGQGRPEQRPGGPERDSQEHDAESHGILSADHDHRFSRWRPVSVGGDAGGLPASRLPRSLWASRPDSSVRRMAQRRIRLCRAPSRSDVRSS